jgi:ActD protein
VRRSFVIAKFSDAETLINAVRKVRVHNFSVYDVYAPYPIHGLDEAMGVRHSRIPWVTFIMGFAGLLTALTFQFYTAIFDWPLNVGGKPDNSTLAFVPISFELTVLIAGLSTVAALLLRARLFPGKQEELPIEGVTNDKFALVVRKKNEGFDVDAVIALLNQSGAKEVELREARL